MNELYADIVVPIARDFFTFRVGDAAAVREGMGVAVNLGPRKVYTGIVWRLHGEKPPFKVRDIGKTVYLERMLSMEQMKFWEWVAGYYMCTLGEVMRFAVPAALKPSGMSEGEFERDEFRPATAKFLTLHPSIENEERLREACASLGRAKVQYKALMELCSAIGLGDGGKFEECAAVQVRRDRLAASDAVIEKLRERELVAVLKREPLPQESAPVAEPLRMPELTPAQSAAHAEIEDNFKKQSCVLLHGVTGSGKTEIYMHLIAEQLAAGRSVLYMMPEIAMTSQIVARIRRVFADRLTIYHSRITDRRRGEAYRKLGRSRGGELILGVRSSIFLPLPNLGLIIVDEEHDQSYKQSENQPRYNARDCAVWLARQSGARCLLASATPSAESFLNAVSGKYGLVRLTERYGGALLPEIVVSDTLSSVKRGERKSHFNKILLDSLRQTLAEGKQAMLFQNRRAFAPYVECVSCGWTARCPRCSVSLSYHRAENSLRCHVCGFSTAMYHICPECGSGDLQPRGFGTEKVEEELSALLPGARIARLDRDTAMSARNFERIIGDFEARRSDILVGTMMITKGFDFPGVSLVGILNADNLLNYPDFRASERAYQIMVQMAGRAGRSAADGSNNMRYHEGSAGAQSFSDKDSSDRDSSDSAAEQGNVPSFSDRDSSDSAAGQCKGDSGAADRSENSHAAIPAVIPATSPAVISAVGSIATGKVIIQTSQPGNQIIVDVVNNDYEAMIRSQLAERAAFCYPPYGRLINVIIKHKDKELLDMGAGFLAARMRELFGDRVYGPHAPVIEKISNENIMTVLLKLENGYSPSKAKEQLTVILTNFMLRKEFRSLSLSCDVDPQ